MSRWKYNIARRKIQRTEEDYRSLRKKKWLLISLILVLVIGAGYYYNYVYNTPIKRIEQLVKKYEANKRILNNIDEMTKYVESDEFQKEMEDHKKKN